MLFVSSSSTAANAGDLSDRRAIRRNAAIGGPLAEAAATPRNGHDTVRRDAQRKGRGRATRHPIAVREAADHRRIRIA
jgi:hypothetical protein